MRTFFFENRKEVTEELNEEMNTNPSNQVAVERLRRSGCENVHGIVCHVAKEEDRKKLVDFVPFSSNH